MSRDSCQIVASQVLKGWFSLGHKHKHKPKHKASENTHDKSISRNITTNPLFCRMLFSLAHKHKHKKSEHVRFSYAYKCLCASENSIRRISGFVLLPLLLLLLLLVLVPMLMR